MRSDALDNPRLSGDPTHNPPGGVTVDSFTGTFHEDRALEALTDRKIEDSGDARRQRHRHNLPALASHRQDPMTALQAQRLDIGAQGFRDAQPVQRQQRYQRVVSRR